MALPALQDVLKRGLLLAPDIFDGISLKAAEHMGCSGALLSASALTHASCGMPDEGTLSCTDMVWSLSRMVEDCSSIPLIAEVRGGYSDNLRIIPYELERIVKAGASAILLGDRAFGCGSDSPELTLVSPEVFAEKIRIAADTVSDTECLVLARTFCRSRDEAILRCRTAQKAGAHMTGAVVMRSAEDARIFAAEVPGDKLWSDLTVTEGQPDVTAEELEHLGYRIALITFMEKGAWFGNMDYGIKNWSNKNTVYADLHDYDGYLRAEDGSLRDYHYIFSYWKKWMPLEKSFQDLRELGSEALQEVRS